MAQGASTSVARQIESLFDGGSVAGLSDRQLLERFAASGDPSRQAAFAALVNRHGPMVLAICHQLLGDRHHAEDAFQAVFLVLAKKARSIREPELLSHWLYGVALRTGRQARARLLGRRNRERGGSMMDRNVSSDLPPADRLVAREHAEALHDEVGRLPVVFQLPVVLCYLEGLTIEEAAGQLQWPDGTVRSRLARARDKLRRGLTRRGVVLPAVIVSALASRSASASVSTSLCDITSGAATNFAAGRAATGATSAFAIALAWEVLRSMLIHRLEQIAVVIFFVGAVTAGVAFSPQAPVRRPGEDQVQYRQAGKPHLHQVAAKPADTTVKPGPGRMFVTGRVLDPNGNPVFGASVAVHAHILSAGRTPSPAGRLQVPLGDVRTDHAGRFRVDLPRTSSANHPNFGAIALAPGFGPGWLRLDADAAEPAADITLTPEQVVHGRLLDVQGKPVPGVRLSVQSIRRSRRAVRARRVGADAGARRD